MTINKSVSRYGMVLFALMALPSFASAGYTWSGLPAVINPGTTTIAADATVSWIFATQPNMGTVSVTVLSA
jgi:hypothetical protein